MRILLSLAIGVVLGFSDHLLDSYVFGPHFARTVTVLDELIVGFLSAVLTFSWMTLAATSRAHERQRLALAAELNHHLRNHLQGILLAADSEDERIRMRTISDAVDQIDQVLRELVPTPYHSTPGASAKKGDASDGA